MVITQAILDDLTRRAKNSPRLRMNLECIHRHQHTSETVVCLRGRVVEEFYDELDGLAGSPQSICTDSIVMTPNGPNVAVNIPAGQWHSIRAVESGSVVLAVKDGKYEPLTDTDVLVI